MSDRPEETIALSCYGLASSHAVAIAAEAERLGFAGIWLGEHALTPLRYGSEHPYGGDHAIPMVGASTPLSDLMVTVGAMAAVTTRMFLGTGIYILPLRHPLTTALAAATVQEIAGGRLLFGVGTGWLGEEFRALGQDFRSRGARTDEIVPILRRAWEGGPVAGEGPFYPFDPVTVTTVERRVPLVFGGVSEAALRRAAHWGAGWHSPSSTSARDCAQVRARLAELLCAAGRGDTDFRFHVRVMDPTPRAADAYRAAGFTDLSLSTLALWRTAEEVPLERKLADLRRLATLFALPGA